LKRIFEPFFTKRRKGSGLGLSIVQRIMEEHSGTVTAGNRPEGGAIMTIRFPLLRNSDKE
jgi:signal transduction histidine kinase